MFLLVFTVVFQFAENTGISGGGFFSKQKCLCSHLFANHLPFRGLATLQPAEG